MGQNPLSYYYSTMNLNTIAPCLLRGKANKDPPKKRKPKTKKNSKIGDVTTTTTTSRLLVPFLLPIFFTKIVTSR
jgi:hypothetical protein